MFLPPVLPLFPHTKKRENVEPAVFEVNMKFECHLVDKVGRHNEKGGKIRDVAGGSAPSLPS
jgi:hypothetical protein